MIRVDRTYSKDDIEQVMEHPRNVRAIRGDNSESMEWPINEFIIYLGVYLYDQIVGLFTFLPKSKVILDSHVAMLPMGYR